MERYVMECMGLTKTYGRKTALDKVDLKIESGRIIGLLGPNGSGKTTLIKLACGLLSPTSGEIAIDGHAQGCIQNLWFPICRTACTSRTGCGPGICCVSLRIFMRTLTGRRRKECWRIWACL